MRSRTLNEGEGIVHTMNEINLQWYPSPPPPPPHLPNLPSHLFHRIHCTKFKTEFARAAIFGATCHNTVSRCLASRVHTGCLLGRSVGWQSRWMADSMLSVWFLGWSVGWQTRGMTDSMMSVWLHGWSVGSLGGCLT